MPKYQLINNIGGWLSFLIAAFIYTSTMEPVASLWDCGEFISGAYKLQIVHAPGAPFFLMLGRLFTLVAGNDTSLVAPMVNSLSALASAFAIMFLFWTTTALAKKLIIKQHGELNDESTLLVMGAGIIAAMTCTFSDTFWFSAVEGEVYALSSFFTALVFWIIMKWDGIADQPRADRWLILIAYMMGLSIGVHLLNLLAVPAIALVYYFRKYKPTRQGIIAALMISGVVLALVLWGIIPGLPAVASKYELLFVNDFGLPFGSGALVTLLLLVTSIITGLMAAHRDKQDLYVVSLIALNFILGGSLSIGLVLNVIFVVVYIASKKNLIRTITIFYLGVIPGYFVWQTLLANKNKEELWANFRVVFNKSMLGFSFIILGYSTYAMVVIRANAEPAIDMSSPSDVFRFQSYLNREQYGTWPVLKGQYFTAKLINVEEGKMQYYQGEDKYEELGPDIVPVYDPLHTGWFPRAWSSQRADHVTFYENWMGLEKGEKPSFGKNVMFFLTYQLNYIYGRYFMWNFSGRQNDIQGRLNEGKNGDWLTGITFFDEKVLGLPKQTDLPSSIKDNNGRNRYYLLPFFLGLIGLIYHFQHKKKDAFTIMVLFVFTGIMISTYLNPTPLQPRERDYAYVGSYYTYCIWIGLGLLAIYEFLKGYAKGKLVIIMAILGCLCIPALMASENWDDHNRSTRYAALAMAKNYLESCQPNAILFTQGDNDTYPLWYAQEVEGIRTDVRTVNLSLLGVDWYIDFVRRKVNDAEPIKLSLSPEQYRGDNRNVLQFLNTGKFDQEKYYDLQKVIDFVTSEDPKYRVGTRSGGTVNYLPVKKFSVPVDADQVIKSGTLTERDRGRIVKDIRINLGGKRSILKPDLITLDIIANNNWERPIYFATSVSSSAYIGLRNYFMQEGLTYRVMPVITDKKDGLPGGINTEIMYDNVMNKFAWIEDKGKEVYLNDDYLRNIMNVRNSISRLAEDLLLRQDRERAVAVLDKCIEGIPEKFAPYYGPYSMIMLRFVSLYYRADQREKARKILYKVLQYNEENLNYFAGCNAKDRARYKTELEQSLQIIQELVRYTGAYKDTDVETELKDKLIGLQQSLFPAATRTQAPPTQ